MNAPKGWTAPAAIGLLALIASAVPSSGVAQDRPRPPATKDMPDHQKMGGMSAMAGPHQALAMAYRDNLVTFGRAIRAQMAGGKAVDVDLARPAVAEMRRSFEQMQQHHQAQMATMGEHAAMMTPEMKEHMATHLTALGEHLSALESEVNATTPDPSSMSEHTAAVLKECAGMSAMPAKAKPHKMK